MNNYLNNARGYCGIGIYNVKNSINVGGLWRHAQAFGAAFIFTIGRRYCHEASDTTNAWKHMPFYRFDTFDQFVVARPKDCPLIGIEISDKSISLPRFAHPERAIYLLGAEDQGLPAAIMGQCQQIVEIPTRFCLNVATAGGIVLYDRVAKRGDKK